MPTTKRHIVVIDPAQHTPELDAFNRLSLRHQGSYFTYHLPALFGVSSLADMPVPPSGIIIMGSAASVHDQLVWQNELRNYLSQQISQEVPILGLCYGHQLLAYMLGATIGFYNDQQEKLKGVREIAFQNLGFPHSPERLSGPLIVSHRELVLEVPEGCRVTASSPGVPVDGFAHNQKPLWGIQAHPEAGPGFLHNQNIPVANPWEAIDFGSQLITGFLSYCSRHS